MSKNTIEAFLRHMKERGVPPAPDSVYHNATYTVSFPAQPAPPADFALDPELREMLERAERERAERKRREPPEPWRSLPGAEYLLDSPFGHSRGYNLLKVICSWTVYNPLGDSECTLSVATSRSTQNAALHWELDHCEFPREAIIAVMPGAVARDQARLSEVVYAAFQRNEFEDLWLLKAPPHVVSVCDVLTGDQVRRCFVESPEVARHITDTRSWWATVSGENDG